ncbi:hypothetical protein J5I95_16555 [Candidatus Poribacteria bacterium]|nr:hypothetical protein [Candidatus Poribacteria bacterium]
MKRILFALLFGLTLSVSHIPHSTIAELTNSGEDYPSWSPDGTQLACTHFGANVYIEVINVNGGDLRLITEGFYPSWQPSGLVAVNPVGWFISTWGWVKVGGSRK